jgi:hypothetical protein
VVVTGHSLGAALATLGAFWLKSIMPSVSDAAGGGLHQWWALERGPLQACRVHAHLDCWSTMAVLRSLHLVKGKHC